MRELDGLKWEAVLDDWERAFGDVDALTAELVGWLAEAWVPVPIYASSQEGFDAPFWWGLLGPMVQQLDPWVVAVVRAGLGFVPAPEAWYEQVSDPVQLAIERAHARGDGRV